MCVRDQLLEPLQDIRGQLVGISRHTDKEPDRTRSWLQQPAELWNWLGGFRLGLPGRLFGWCWCARLFHHGHPSTLIGEIHDAFVLYPEDECLALSTCHMFLPQLVSLPQSPEFTPHFVSAPQVFISVRFTEARCAFVISCSSP